MAVVYLIGSLRNPEIVTIANRLQAETGHEVFADWFAAGPIADDSWQEYEKTRGKTYDEALRGYAAQHVFHFDLNHLHRADIGLLALPAGKSGHLELGYMLGKGKKGYILLDGEPERWDVMYNFCSGVYFNIEDLIKELNNHVRKQKEQTPFVSGLSQALPKRPKGSSEDLYTREQQIQYTYRPD